MHLTGPERACTGSGRDAAVEYGSQSASCMRRADPEGGHQGDGGAAALWWTWRSSMRSRVVKRRVVAKCAIDQCIERVDSVGEWVEHGPGT